ncbi:unnamed protein product, partial [marine sediment metagenome]
RTDLGTERLEETEEELEEPKEEPEPPQRESLTTQFKIHNKQRVLLNRCEELSTLDWEWNNFLLKDFELLEDNVGFIKQKLNAASSLEELEELELLIEDLDKSWKKLFIRNEELFKTKGKFELKDKLDRIREFYTEIYSSLSQEELEEMIKKCEEDPEKLKDTCQSIEYQENYDYLLEHAFEYEIDPRFIRNIHNIPEREKLELKYVVKLWEDYKLLASRYGTQETYHFLIDRKRTILKKRGSLWKAFHKYMFPQRTPAPAH